MDSLSFLSVAAATQFECYIHILSSPLDVVDIDNLGLSPAEHRAATTHLAVVQATPLLGNIGPPLLHR